MIYVSLNMGSNEREVENNVVHEMHEIHRL